MVQDATRLLSVGGGGFNAHLELPLEHLAASGRNLRDPGL